MAIMRFNFRSQAMNRHVDITITLPTDEFSYYDEKDHPYTGHPFYYRPLTQYKPGMKLQTVYFIQGGGDDDTLVYRNMNVERYADGHAIMLVTPNIVNSLGADTDYGVNSHTFLTEELPVVIQTLFPSSPKREDNFIVGYAMGGNVALSCAIMRPDLYAACVDMSGGIGYTLRTDTIVGELSDPAKPVRSRLLAAFGPAEKFEGSKHDLMTYVRKYQAEGIEWPKFTLMCGELEFIRERVEGDVSALKELGIPCDYYVTEGCNHDFDNWDPFSRKVFDEILPLKNHAIFPEE